MSDKKIEVSVVAKRLNVSVSTIYRLFDAGLLKGARMGLRKGIRIYEFSVFEFEESRKAL